ncbi:hypothetical protein F5144DRAFT_3192 [Chaetomium tenue]|uniref:Uncharacterized protein n=1 Tax=Chaetomium tenue TaxID=1854479 RepID=A0ACB7PKM7_9PEZI|nr:hypothetical protein F5144DRAFT_3192 [Chaetomium globosum]
MGAVQAVPVVGEALTVIDSAGRTVAAGVCYPFNHDTAEKLINSAGKSWEDYAARNLITSNVRAAYAELTHDDAQAQRLLKAQAQAWEELGENTPVAGHVMAVVHYCEGDEEGAERCLNSANRSTAIIAAAVATGGAGAIAAGTATLVAGVAYDAAVTAEKSIEKGEFTPNGYIGLAEKAIKSGDACDVYSLVTTPIADFATGAMGGEGSTVTRQAKMKMAPLSELSAVPRKLVGEESAAATTSDFHFSYHEPGEGALAANEAVAAAKASGIEVNLHGEEGGAEFGAPRRNRGQGRRTKPSDGPGRQPQTTARPGDESYRIADSDTAIPDLDPDHLSGIEDMEWESPKIPDVHMAYEYEDCAWRCMARLKDMTVEEYAHQYHGKKFDDMLTMRSLGQIKGMVEQQGGIIVIAVEPDMILDVAQELNRLLNTKKAAVAYTRVGEKTGHVITIENLRKRANPKNRLEAEYLADRPRCEHQFFDYQPRTDEPGLSWIAKKGVNAAPDVPFTAHVFAVPPVAGDVGAMVGRAPTNEAVMAHQFRKLRDVKQMEAAWRRQNGRDAVLSKRRGFV